MSYWILVFLCGLCALSYAYAFNPQQTESFFYISPVISTLNQPFIRTKNYTLIYSVEVIMSNFTSAPQFLAVNLETGDSSIIIEDLASSCGQNNATYNRLYYHSNTSSLVYYCTRNNTLMILDEENFTVQSTIPLQVQADFNETKFYSEGSSVVILGMGSPFTYTTASQLIKINLQTKEVVRQVIFDKGLDNGEVITAYASSGLLSFALTIISSNETNTATVTIYSVVFVGNLYKLTRLSTFTYEMTSLHLRTSELFCLGNYLVTNDYENLLVMNILGNVVQNFTNLTFIWQDPDSGPQDFDVPIYAMQHGSSSLYAEFNNNTILKISVDGTTLTSEFVIEGIEAHFAIGNQYANDLLFSTIFANFTVLDLQESKLVYNALVSNDEMFLTTSTICSYNDGELNVFSRSHLPIADLILGDVYFYEPVGQVFYYITNTTRSCDLFYFHPDTQASGQIASVLSGNNCSTVRSLYARFTNNITAPDHSYWVGDKFHMFTSTYGLVAPNMSSSTSTIGIPDFDTQTIYTVTPDKVSNSTYAVKYAYNNVTDSFDIQGNFNFTNIPAALSTNYFISGNQTITVFAESISFVINLTDFSSHKYTLPNYFNTFSGFYDNLGNNYVIYSRNTIGTIGVLPPEYLGPDQVLTTLPETDEYFERAGGAGFCSYFVKEGYISSFITVRFYNICSNANELIVSI